MLEVISQHLCREYTITCPACGQDNVFPRLKPDIYRARQTEPDGHPTEIGWRAEVEFPKWVTPLNYFWAVCPNCQFTGQVDDQIYRTWKKNAKKFQSQYIEGVLTTLSDLADEKRGVAYQLGTAIPSDDIFGTQLAQSFLGIFTECQKNAPVAGSLGRSYLRIAWLYRDEERLYDEFAPSSRIREVIEEIAPAWEKAIPPHDSFRLPPQLATDEVEALRCTLAFFELNFSQLQSTVHEDEIRLMTLIAEIGYRIYELTGDDEDFTQGQNLFSGAMQKCLAVINDKTIVGGAVTKAKDTLEKVGERGRELRALQKTWEKVPPEERPKAKTAKKAPPPPPPPKKEAVAEKNTAPQQKPSVFDAGALVGNTQELQKKIEHLDAENKRWMRLAGMSDITDLPNRVMLSKVLLPGAFKQAIQRKEPIGCIFLSPRGLDKINGTHGHKTGDMILQKFAASLKELVRNGERLCHLEGVNFALIVPRMTSRQLGKRAEIIHKDLISRRYELGTEALSLQVSASVFAVTSSNGEVSPKALQETLYNRSLAALDKAKMQGNHIEIISET